MTRRVPAIRITRVNRAPVDPSGDYVLYWMIAARRTRHNFALQRAVELSEELRRPIVVFEPLRAGYRWASDRHHMFVLQGMRDNAAALVAKPATYYPYVEPRPGEGRGLLAALARRAAAVVTDDFPCFFLPDMVAAAGERLPVRLEKVDGNGLYPMRATDRVFTTAASFRRHLQKELPPHLGDMPAKNPLRRLRVPAAEVPTRVLRRWPAVDPTGDLDALVAALPIDHVVPAVKRRGGARAADRALAGFLRDRLAVYADQRNQPDKPAQSNLSPYLHFGHVSAHEVAFRLLQREDWSPARLAAKPNGSRHGWWGASPTAEAFLDELITWRELGYNRCALQRDYGVYETLPEWAQKTLADHAGDPRSHVYSLAAFERAETHDRLWNAAQRQLVREGIIHNYLRMLWGKKILEWTRHPRDALAVMIELNNKYALDGRDPNSYSGIFWVLGRYDRAWGPERPVFGKVRYMSSDNTARKVRVKEYLRRYAA